MRGIINCRSTAFEAFWTGYSEGANRICHFHPARFTRSRDLIVWFGETDIRLDATATIPNCVWLHLGKTASQLRTPQAE